MPLMMSRPDSSASMSEGIQLSLITPPVLATPDDECSRAARAGLLGRQSRQISGDCRPAARPLAHTAIRSPIAQTECGLGVTLFRGVARKQQIRVR